MSLEDSKGEWKEECCGAEQDLEVKSYLENKSYKGRH
jgi:hypothetical protein